GGGQVGGGVAERERRVPRFRLAVTAALADGAQPGGAGGRPVPRRELARRIDRVRLARPRRVAADRAAPFTASGRAALWRGGTACAGRFPDDGQARWLVVLAVGRWPVLRPRAGRGGSWRPGTTVGRGAARRGPGPVAGTRGGGPAVRAAPGRAGRGG